MSYKLLFCDEYNACKCRWTCTVKKSTKGAIIIDKRQIGFDSQAADVLRKH